MYRYVFVLSELSRASGELNKAIAVLGEAGEASHKLMDGEIGHILDKIHNVTNHIKEIEPVLHAAKALESVI